MSALKLFPCAAINTVSILVEVGDDRVVPVRQHAHDDVGQALGARAHLGRQPRVPDVVELGELVVLGERRRGRVIGAPPQHELLLAVLGQRRRLVLALQRAVVPFVQPPRATYRDPHPLGRVERQLGRADRPSLHRGVDDVGGQTVLHEQLAATPSFGPSLLGEIDVHPAREQVALVPVALPVSQQDQRADHPWRLGSRARLGVQSRRLTIDRAPGMVRAVSITNDDIKSEWELGDVIQVTMDADGTDGDSDGTDGDSDGTDGESDSDGSDA